MGDMFLSSYNSRSGTSEGTSVRLHLLLGMVRTEALPYRSFVPLA